MNNLISSIKSKDLAGVAAALKDIKDINELIQGETALTTAAAVGDLDIVKVLLDAGAKINITNAKSKLPVDIAMSNGKMDAWVYLNGIPMPEEPVDQEEILDGKAEKAIENLIRKKIHPYDSNKSQLEHAFDLFNSSTISNEDSVAIKYLLSNEKRFKNSIKDKYNHNDLFSIITAMLSVKYEISSNLAFGNKHNITGYLNGLMLMINDENKSKIMDRIESEINKDKSVYESFCHIYAHKYMMDLLKKINPSFSEDFMTEIVINLNDKYLEKFSHQLSALYTLIQNPSEKPYYQKVIDEIAKRGIQADPLKHTSLIGPQAVNNYIEADIYRANHKKLGLDNVIDLPVAAIKCGLYDEFKTLTTEFSLSPKIDYKSMAEITIGIISPYDFPTSEVKKDAEQKKTSQDAVWISNFNYTSKSLLLETLESLGFKMSNIDFESAYKNANIKIKDVKEGYVLRRILENINTSIIYGKDHGFKLNDSEIINDFKVWKEKINDIYKNYHGAGSHCEHVANILVELNGINSHDEDGMTPLMIAAKSADFTMISALIDNGADINIKDNKDMNALAHLAKSRKVRDKEYSLKVFAEHIQDPTKKLSTIL